MWENPDFENQYTTMLAFYAALYFGKRLCEDEGLVYFSLIFFAFACIILNYVVRVSYSRMIRRVKNNELSLKVGIFGLFVSFLLSYVYSKFLIFVGKTGAWFWWGKPFPLIPFIQDRSFLL